MRRVAVLFHHIYISALERKAESGIIEQSFDCGTLRLVDDGVTFHSDSLDTIRRSAFFIEMPLNSLRYGKISNVSLSKLHMST